MKRVIGIVLLTTIFFTFSGCKKNTTESNIPGMPASYESSNLVNIILYFPDKNAQYLVPEERKTVFNKSLEETIMGELIKGPSSDKVSNPIPQGTGLISINRSKDTITVNLSKEFAENHPGGSTGEIMTIYSIVNSLTEIPGTGKVLFKVGGKSLQTLKGHLVFNEPFKRNRDLLLRDKTLKPDEVLRKQMNYEKQGNYLAAYGLMSDNENDPYRKYYNDYVKEMEEVSSYGYTKQEFLTGGYALDKSGLKARVKLNFYVKADDNSKNLGEDLYFNCVRIQGAWMVDWLTAQEN